MNTNINVSVIIVCMNNYGVLKDCLQSIQKFTTKVSYEVLLVAYFFSKDNLELLKKEFPWVKLIISNEIRGFSANNNLALRQAQGEYCFVLNDDTYMTMPVIDCLYETLESNKYAALVSPQILSPNGFIQYTGLPPITWSDWLKFLYKLKKETDDPTHQYIKNSGIFKSYNMLGAAFMVKTDVFKEVGFFDERFFFGPEDKYLSTILNKRGYECWVNADVKIYHLGGQTGGVTTKSLCATRPANRKGALIMYSEGKIYRKILISLLIWIDSFCLSYWWLIKYLFNKNKSNWYSFVANINVCRTIFSKKSTTDIFKKFYC